MGAFADRLWRLKQEAGDPSYAEMSARLGAAASKSSLAAAAQGQALPSWETTWEFVRVLAVDRLGHDPSDTEKQWRERWTRAKAAEQPAAGEVPPPAAEPAVRRPRGHRQIGIAAVAFLTGAVLVFAVLHRPAGSGAKPAASDDSQFEGDITYPDGTLVPPNSSFMKVWRLRNTGTIVWANRFLARVNEESCQAPKAVAIPQTGPGETVDIAVPIRTPSRPGNCKIYWKMADEQGRMLFPLKRPIFVDIRVGGS